MCEQFVEDLENQYRLKQTEPESEPTTLIHPLSSPPTTPGRIPQTSGNIYRFSGLSEERSSEPHLGSDDDNYEVIKGFSPARSH